MSMRRTSHALLVSVQASLATVAAAALVLAGLGMGIVASRLETHIGLVGRTPIAGCLLHAFLLGEPSVPFSLCVIE